MGLPGPGSWVRDAGSCLAQVRQGLFWFVSQVDVFEFGSMVDGETPGCVQGGGLDLVLGMQQVVTEEDTTGSRGSRRGPSLLHRQQAVLGPAQPLLRVRVTFDWAHEAG